jgi:ribonuclease P protein component
MKPPDSQAPLRTHGEGADTFPAGRDAATPRPGRLPATLQKRSEFLACARARRVHMPGLSVQGRRRRAGEAAGGRVGFTCPKKVGGAVVRNRAKRRLREAARVVLPRTGRADWDYVLIGRAGATVTRRFAELVGDLEAALAKLHREKPG